MTQFRVLIDANVLFSVIQTDALLYPAEFLVFVPLWSAEIRDEWTRNLVAHIQKGPADMVEKRTTSVITRANMMDRFFPQSIVPQASINAELPGIAAYAAQHKKPPASDIHVLATAVAGNADFLVTRNARHFPARYTVNGSTIVRIHPDAFLHRMLLTNPEGVLDGYRRRVAQSRIGLTMDAIVDQLSAKEQLPRSAKLLRKILTNPPTAS